MEIFMMKFLIVLLPGKVVKKYDKFFKVKLPHPVCTCVLSIFKEYT